VDLGEAAVRLSHDLLAEEGLAAQFSIQNIMALDFADRQFDCSLCFRLLHHFQDRQDKASLIRELCRVSSRFVVISYFSTRSLTTLKRLLRQQFSGKPLKQYPDDLRDLETLFSSNGFRLYRSVERSRVLHSLQVAVFERAN
jgi:ubiquinone/menaquinone biosynthesis C-methylase UbiE